MRRRSRGGCIEVRQTGGNHRHVETDTEVQICARVWIGAVMGEREEGDRNIKGQMKLVPSGHSDCSFYSVTCHWGSRCLLGVPQAGLLTQSTFNITY